MIDAHALALETSDLSFSFSKDHPVIKGLNMRIPKGSFYGFLGPNGAGKTTTIRLLLDLLPSSSGAVKIFGKSYRNDRNGILSRIGTLIETPSLYDHLTGFDNLKVTADLRCITKERVWQVLEMVGLATEGEKYVHSYSLGMKQRLGLALALLSSPDLLILDEPTNGLDPNGIIEIRGLLRDLNVNHRVTILISSHLLSEVERLVSHVGIIGQGKMLFQGRLKELQQMSREKAIIEIDTDDNIRALAILMEDHQPIIKAAQFLAIQLVNKDHLAQVIALLTGAGLRVNRAQLVERSLEETFLSLIKDNHL
ncbi:ATP-binding cassette domain-containing protein [Dyadobacter chenwenxiniae]|uniref:ATP-binding cassette domain-containing protein n=1 Tax=Dyadobacter chenwenxiniae TaxID=2906456 RepID=A0A9X1TFR4_9BACT|nr:ATP-binding cassette domain-containing protein [Dyadobacter chenwenxiniae]MCF0063252.1 ATP-binding cassette domain-containing protein [Dyadobacter chenwenxiniae]UON85367.1 ATP-binding cassette domain-containing protein [Dyadobacter chenwenxiniae]